MQGFILMEKEVLSGIKRETFKERLFILFIYRYRSCNKTGGLLLQKI